MMTKTPTMSRTMAGVVPTAALDTPAMITTT